MTFEERYRHIINEQKCNIQANELKKGDIIKNINPQCLHNGTEGKVTRIKKNNGKGGVSGATVCYKVTNDPKNSGKYNGKELEKTEIQLSKKNKGELKESSAYVEKKNIHSPVRPGILKRAAGGGKLSCSKARAVKAKQKNKGNNTAKAAQRYLNYHC